MAELPLAAVVIAVLWTVVWHRDWQGISRAAVACLCVISIEWAFAQLAPQPRPFAAGFGPALARHDPNNAMPSTHAALAWSLASVMGLQRRWVTAIVVATLGMIMAWARVYIGLHWPADMLGAALSAGAASLVAKKLVSDRPRSRPGRTAAHR